MNNSTKNYEEDTYGIDDISNAEIYFNAVFLSIVMITTIVGNSLALHAFFISPELKQITYYFIASLCISDLMVALFSISLWIIDLLNKWGQEGLPTELKSLYQCVDIFGGTWSIMSLAFISIERYICIKHALHYSYIMTLKRVYVLFAFLLVYCSIVTILNDSNIDENSTAHLVKQFSIVFMAYVLPVLIKVFTYSEIYLEAKRQSHQINELRKYTLTLNDNSSDIESPGKSIESLSDINANSPLSKRNPLNKGGNKISNNNAAKWPLVKTLPNIFLRCFRNDDIDKTGSTQCLQYTRDTSISNGTIRITHSSSDILDSTSEIRNDIYCNKIIETEFNKEDVCRNQDPKSQTRHKLTKGNSLDESSKDGYNEYHRTCRTFSTDDYRNIRQNLNPMSALEDYHPKPRMSDGSGSPIMKRLRTLSKWSPTTSPLIVRKLNKKSSEQKRNEQKIRRFKKELRAAKVVGLIMGTFLICWTPFNVLMLLYAIHVNTVMRYVMLAKLLHYLNSAINPVLYVVLNKVYRTAVGKVIKKFKLFINCQ